MTDAERQKRRYDRKKAGLVRIEAWVPADKAEDVRKAIEVLAKAVDSPRENR
jgi:vacuolar-type H+-ATPase subunit I/STV1